MEGNSLKLTDDILKMGIAMGASDIHLEPTEEDLKIRMRIDGVLREVARVGASRAALISRIKIMSGLDIAEKRVPQDGRSEFVFEKRKVDLRVASLPTIFGEKIVVRILDKAKSLQDISSLNFSQENLSIYEKLYRAPHGMVLLTGPTGSGKSTTLYATLEKLNSVEKNIITVEDPVEYQLPGINQVAVNVKTGLSFAKGLRSIVRQDPDIIMVGEIRDAETAEIAVHAALTGHLVLSTLHANTAIGAVTRLLDMGIERYQLVAAFNGSVSQRLVRKLCDKCKKKRSAKSYELEYLGKNNNMDLYAPCGCSECGNTGYRGRVAVHEIFVMDDDVLDIFVRGANEKELSALAVNKGMKTLREDGRTKVLLGLTTVEELLKAGV